MQPFGCTRLHQMEIIYKSVRYKKIFQDVLDKYINVCYITINVSEMYVPYNILFNRKETLICLRIGIVRT